MLGYEEMMKRLDPLFVIFYGKVPEECDWNVIKVHPHYDDIKQRRDAKWEGAAKAPEEVEEVRSIGQALPEREAQNK